MNEFIIKELITKNLESELEKIGFDIAYRAKASEKFQYKTFKIFNLTLPQANILKQTALSLGADCGVHRDILTAKTDKTDVIIGGSYSQIKKICDKLSFQPFSMKILADNLINQLETKNAETKLVGILNVTPNSFSDGGEYLDPNKAITQLNKLVEDGADIVDIGAESTKPYAPPVPAKEQIQRIKPVLKNLPNIPISIDTRNSEVAHFALDHGVSIINDVSGMSFDNKMGDIVAKYNATLILQHSTTKTEDRPHYNDVVEEVYLNLIHKTEIAKEKGIKKIILDPGIGFGKTKEENFEILNRIEEFYSLNNPIMIGISRKSLLGINENNNELKDIFTLALSYPLIQKKVDFLRVHNVKLHRQLLDSVI